MSEAGINPYGSPPVAGPSYSASLASDAVEPQVVELLRQTRGWVLLFGILGFLGTGLFLFVAVIMLVGTIAGGGGNNFSIGVGIGISAVYIGLGVLYAVPSFLLVRYFLSINALVALPSASNLIDAVRVQRNFWRTTGIIFLIGIGLYVVVIAIAIVAGIAAA